MTIMSTETRTRLSQEKANLDPKDIDAHISLATKYAREYDYQEALNLTIQAYHLLRESLKQNKGGNYAKLFHLLGSLRELYSGLGLYEHALERNKMLQNMLGCCKDGFVELKKKYLESRVKDGELFIEWGKYDEAFDSLNSVEKETEGVSVERAMIWMLKGKGMYMQGNGRVAKKRLETAAKILEKLKSGEGYYVDGVAKVYDDIAGLYEKMEEFGLVADMLKKALEIVKKLDEELVKTQQWMIVLTGRIGESLVRCEGKVEEGLVYLNESVKVLQEHIDAGSKFLEHDLGVTYNGLGIAYWKIGNADMAEEMFEKARDLAISSRGPYHPTSMRTRVNVAAAHTLVGRF